jgi:hypothetical protein
MTCKDAPDWSDTVNAITEPSPLYLHGVYDLPGAEVFNEYVTGSDDNYEFYTVPADKVVYITFIRAQIRLTDDGLKNTYVGLETLPGDAWPWFNFMHDVAGVAAETWTFPVPIRCGEGSEFTFYADPGCSGYFQLLGYILDAE